MKGCEAAYVDNDKPVYVLLLHGYAAPSVSEMTE